VRGERNDDGRQQQHLLLPPDLRPAAEYYSKLLKEPIPQQLKDLLSMLEEASGSADVAMPSEPEARDQAAPREPQSDSPTGKPR
jgi:hypothetical protein